MIGALFISFMVADENLPIIGFFWEIPNPIYSMGGPEWLKWTLSVIVALGFAALLGLVIERIAIRPMIGEKIKVELIERNWPDILRLAASAAAGAVATAAGCSAGAGAGATTSGIARIVGMHAILVTVKLYIFPLGLDVFTSGERQRLIMRP